MAKMREQIANGTWPSRAEVLARRQREADAKPESPGKKFVDAWGEQGGVWYAQGKSFDECKRLHSEFLQSQAASLEVDRGRLKDQVARLRNQLAAGEFMNGTGSDGLSRFAAGINPSGGTSSTTNPAATGHTAKAGEPEVPANLRNALGGKNGLSRFAAGLKFAEPLTAVIE